MTTLRSLLALGLALGTCLGVAACSSDKDDDAEADNDALSEHQTTGTSLPKMTIALTFDDGPGPRTGELSTYLKEQGIHTIFFMEGIHAKGQDTLMKQVNADGHIIGNHTYDHPLLTSISSAKVLSELTQTDAILAPYFTNKMKIFRAPYGGWSPSIADKLNATPLAGYVGSIFWDIGGELTATHAADWACWGNAHLSIQQCGDRYIQEIHDRGDHGVTLMHDIHSNTIDMVKYLVPKLKSLGYSFARLDQIPAINAQLVAKGATPLPPISATTAADAGADAKASSGIGTQDHSIAPADVSLALGPSCGNDGVFCGSAVGLDSATLYRCTAHALVSVCACTSTCGIGANGVDGACDCSAAASEPGLTDDDLR
jgi:peptidoglycan/xylan/chitin deacetylase (PgdA/CDA1 family)